jgi:hypothetical protein
MMSLSMFFIIEMLSGSRWFYKKKESHKNLSPRHEQVYIWKETKTHIESKQATDRATMLFFKNPNFYCL